jgi:hypothetical protein
VDLHLGNLLFIHFILNMFQNVLYIYMYIYVNVYNTFGCKGIGSDPKIIPFLILYPVCFIAMSLKKNRIDKILKKKWIVAGGRHEEGGFNIGWPGSDKSCQNIYTRIFSGGIIEES